MPNPRKSSKRDRPGPWSDWTISLDDPNGGYYRARQTIAGSWEYEFRDATPRDHDPEALADELANVDISGAGENDSEIGPASSPVYTTRARGKGKGVADPETDPSYEEGYTSDTPTERWANEEDNDADIQAALDQSRLRGRGQQPSSSSAYDPEPTYSLPGDPAYGLPDDDTYALPESVPATAEDPGFMQGEPITHEALDPRYRVHKSKHWSPGTVFKIYWSEPMGANGALSVSGKQVYQGEFGMSFYTGFRRFIIVATDEGHSTCVPVSTYGGQGCRKNGVKANRHGLIYGYGTRPRKDTEKLGFPPVRMNFTAEGEKLSSASRVNYSKLMTIEHNCRVFLIGRIYHKDLEAVQEAVNDCWSGKRHFPPDFMDSH